MHYPRSKETLAVVAVMAAFAVVLTLTNIASAWSLLPDAARSDEAQAAATPTNPKFRKTIRPGGLFTNFFVVSRLAFSPDGRYLAIANGGLPFVVVWDLERDREQSHFRLPGRVGGERSPCWGRDERLLWSPDGRFITDGASYAEVFRPRNVAPKDWDPAPYLFMSFMDPMTGQVAQKVNMQGTHGVFNRDGSKLATFYQRSPGKLLIYDTHTWARTEIDTGLIATPEFDWAEDGRILVVGCIWQRQGHILRGRDGIPFPDKSHVILKIDTAGRGAIEATLVQSSDIDPKDGKIYPHGSCSGAISSLNGRKMAIRCDGVHILDTDSLATLSVYNSSDGSAVYDANNGLDFSLDGRLLYAVGSDSADRRVQSDIIDTTTGRVVGRFPSGWSHAVAISPNGRTMAVGHSNYLELFDLR